MKVSIDGIVNTARKMREQKTPLDEPLKKKKDSINPDSIEIRTKLSSRLIGIQKELAEIQSSLTKNQIIKEGIIKLTDESLNGEELLDEIRFENERVLSDFVGNNLKEGNLQIKLELANTLIEEDISSLKKLQIEVENILASNLMGADIQDTIKDIESTISQIDQNTLLNISTLKPEVVMTLIN